MAPVAPRSCQPPQPRALLAPDQAAAVLSDAPYASMMHRTRAADASLVATMRACINSFANPEISRIHARVYPTLYNIFRKCALCL